MRVIDRPDIRPLSAIGECERLERENERMRIALNDIKKIAKFSQEQHGKMWEIDDILDICKSALSGNQQNQEKVDGDK